MLHESGTHRWPIAAGAVALAAVALAAALAACTPANIVGVETGAEPGTPVFVVTDVAGHGATGWIYGLSVVTCSGDAVLWTIAATGSASAPSRIVYGQTPNGYVSRTGPLPLRPGCYRVYVSESAGARFRVGRDGRVVADSGRGAR